MNSAQQTTNLNELKAAVAAADAADARYGTPQTAWHLGASIKALRAAELAAKERK